MKNTDKFSQIIHRVLYMSKSKY